MELEIWRSVAGRCAGKPYEASSLGRIRNAVTKRVLSPSKNGNGYLGLCIGGEHVRVHLVVAEAFHGPRGDGLEVNHRDGNKNNNRPENLEFITHRDNLVHALRTGLKSMPPEFADLSRSRRKLTPDDVQAIRALIGVKSERALAAQFGVGKTAISRIKRGRCYREVANA